MKLKQLIARLEQIAAQHGDIDVACTEGCDVPENTVLEPKHLLLESGDTQPPMGVVAPYLLIGGSGFED